MYTHVKPRGVTVVNKQCCCSMGMGERGHPEFPCWDCERHPETVMREEGYRCKRHTREYFQGQQRIELANDQLDDLVEIWHLGGGDGQELYEFLGMTAEEYRAWGGDAHRVPERMIDELVEGRP